LKTFIIRNERNEIVNIFNTKSEAEHAVTLYIAKDKKWDSKMGNNIIFGFSDYGNEYQIYEEASEINFYTQFDENKICIGTLPWRNDHTISFLEYDDILNNRVSDDDVYTDVPYAVYVVDYASRKMFSI